MTRFEHISLDEERRVPDVARPTADIRLLDRGLLERVLESVAHDETLALSPLAAAPARETRAALASNGLLHPRRSVYALESPSGCRIVEAFAPEAHATWLRLAL